jgi:glycosyltransferase involved in cell wall biosynthesis
MKTNQDIKLLFFFSGPSMPSRNPAYRGRFEALSQYFSGDIVTHASSEELNLKRIGRFNFIPFHYKKGHPVYRNMRFYLRVLRYALRVIRKNKSYETVIISPDPLGTGLAAIIIGKMTKMKVIVEVNGCFDQALTSYMQKGKPNSMMTRIKEALTSVIVPFVLKKADKVKLLYPSQLMPVLKDSSHLDAVSFHVYIPIKSFLRQKIRDEKFILLLGHPWYLKGVDILIKAFLKISPQFPDHRLVIAGWCPDPDEKAYFLSLTQNHPKIELLDPLKYDDVISYMTRCSMYVSASRTEALGRVLVEAMASRKPIVAPEVDGIPNIVHNGLNGLLFEKESVDDLAEKMMKILTDKTFSEKLATNGYHYCQNHLSEKQYINQYKHMILSAVNK